MYVDDVSKAACYKRSIANKLIRLYFCKKQLTDETPMSQI